MLLNNFYKSSILTPEKVVRNQHELSHVIKTFWLTNGSYLASLKKIISPRG